jgi:hypothetical protein
VRWLFTGATHNHLAPATTHGLHDGEVALAPLWSAELQLLGDGGGLVRHYHAPTSAPLAAWRHLVAGEAHLPRESTDLLPLAADAPARGRLQVMPAHGLEAGVFGDVGSQGADQRAGGQRVLQCNHAAWQAQGVAQ